MQGPIEDVALSRLAHDVVQNTYKEMHALLDSLTDLAPEARRGKLVEFTLEVRHRFARLLVAVRWFMSYSAFHGSAQVTKKMASTRSGVLTNNADILWRISAFVKGVAAHPSAVAEATEILGASAFFARFPRIIESLLGLDASAGINKLDDPEKDGPQSQGDLTAEAVERLRVTTLYVVENSLPSGVAVINTSVEPDNAAVRIGVPGAWTADVILDRLRVDDALLLLLRFRILVGGHPDALGQLYTPWRAHDTPMKLHEEQSVPIRQMIGDRMGWALRDAEAIDKANRMKSAFLCLSRAMSLECAGKIAMEHIRQQASSLTYQSSWKTGALSLSGVGSEAGDGVPVRIRYWPKSHMKASLAVYLSNPDDFHTLETGILQFEHDPKLPGSTLPNLIQLQSIHVEHVLLDTCRIRAQFELRQLEKFCNARVARFIETRVTSRSCSSSALDVTFDGHGPGLSFGISFKSGGFFVRSHGMVSLAQTGTHSLAVEFRTCLWTGERFFAKNPLMTMKSTSVDLIKKASCLLRCAAALENSCAIDAGFIPAWPPGDSFVEKPEETKGGKRIIPPFMAVDRKRPRRFLTLCSVANEDDEVYFQPGLSVSKRARSLPMHFSISPKENQAFIEGRRPEGVEVPLWCKGLHADASSMADWAEVRHAAEIRMRRDNILRQLEGAKLATVVDGDYSLRSPHVSQINMKSSPLDVESAVLVIRGDEGWQIQLTLTNDIFDATNLRGQSVSYFPGKRLLTFSYSVFSTTTLRWFCRDFVRATNSAAVVIGLSNESNTYSVRRREPSLVEVDAFDVKLSIGVRSQSFQMEVTPPKPLITAHLIPLLEEVMQASGNQAGRTLAQLLELSLPVGLAIQAAAQDEPEMFRVKFSTALRARFVVRFKPPQPSFALDIDAREGFNGVVVMDVYRGLALTQGGNNAYAHQFKPIPMWELLLKKVVAKKLGTSIHGGAALRVRMSVLNSIIVAIVRNLQTQALNT